MCARKEFCLAVSAVTLAAVLFATPKANAHSSMDGIGIFFGAAVASGTIGIAGLVTNVGTLARPRTGWYWSNWVFSGLNVVVGGILLGAGMKIGHDDVPLYFGGVHLGLGVLGLSTGIWAKTRRSIPKISTAFGPKHGYVVAAWKF